MGIKLTVEDVEGEERPYENMAEALEQIIPLLYEGHSGTFGAYSWQVEEDD